MWNRYEKSASLPFPFRLFAFFSLLSSELSLFQHDNNILSLNWKSLSIIFPSSSRATLLNAAARMELSLATFPVLGVKIGLPEVGWNEKQQQQRQQPIHLPSKWLIICRMEDEWNLKNLSSLSWEKKDLQILQRSPFLWHRIAVLMNGMRVSSVNRSFSSSACEKDVAEK